MVSSPAEAPADDACLVAASQGGDVDAFGQLIERHHNLVCAIAYSRTGDRLASEDVAQETFLAAWRGLGDLREPEKLRGWLCGIARNLATKSLRRRPHEDIDAHERRAGDPGPLDALLTKELETAVWAALEKLPETYREPLVLFYREDRSIKEVALGLGLTEETAKQRLSRGRQQLKDNVGDLVERTLRAGRPRKAAAAAVLAAIVASGSKPAAATTLAATHATRPARWKLAGAGALLATAATIVIVASSSRGAEVTRPDSNDPRATVTELRRAHQAWAARNAAVRTCELRGVVTRTDGSAVTGGMVALVENSWQATALEPVIVETDTAGRWRAPLAAGAYTISVSASGQRAQARVATCAPARAEEHAFVLQAGGARLQGSVGDTGGGPIVGATVWLLDPQRPSELFVARSRADGAYELLVHPGLYTALVTHPEYTLEARPITLGDKGAHEDVTMLPGATIDGIVVDSAGKPVAGAKVTTVPALQRDAPTRWQMASIYGAFLPATSDANGRFRLRGLAPGSVQLTAHTAALAAATPTSIDLTLAEAKTGATITLGTARAISGFVVARGAERRGMQGVRVIAIRDGAPLAMPAIATTDGAGLFELTGLAPGSYRLAAVGTGFAPYVDAELLAIGDRDVTDRLVVLDRGVALRGHVEPADRASIKLQPAAPTPSLASYLAAAITPVEVDEHGNFSLVAAPGDYTLTATTFDRRGELAVSATSSRDALRVALAPRPAIAGAVIDDAGAPLAGALVAAMPVPARDPFSTTHTTVRADEQGAFAILGVSPGSYDLYVFDARGQRPLAGAKRPFRGQRVEVPESGAVRAELQIASRGGRVAGLVTDAHRRPVADAWIEVRARDARRMPDLFPARPILTDASGRFSIDGVFGAELLVEASGPDGTQRAVAIATPGAQLELVLRPIATLTARITDAGKPVAAFEARLEQRATGSIRRAKGVAGELSLPAMAGEHELDVTSDRGYARTTITIGDATTARVELALTPWSSVRGRVVGRDGVPSVGASLLVHERAEPTRDRTDGGGAFTIERMIAGPNRLTILPATDDDDITTIEVELRPGQTLDLGVIRMGTLRQTTSSASTDLGLRFFVSAKPPTPAQLAVVATDPMAATRDGSDPDAVLWIVAVTPNSAGARAGLRAGDRITGVGMTKVDGSAAAVDMLMSLSQPWRSKGRVVPWAIVRDGKALTVDVLVPN